MSNQLSQPVQARQIGGYFRLGLDLQIDPNATASPWESWLSTVQTERIVQLGTALPPIDRTGALKVISEQVSTPYAVGTITAVLTADPGWPVNSLDDLFNSAHWTGAVPYQPLHDVPS